KFSRRQFLQLAAGAAAFGWAFQPSPIRAQDWPTRPVTMVVPFAAGGATDIVGRLLSPRLSELLGQQVIIENVGGAGAPTPPPHAPPGPTARLTISAPPIPPPLPQTNPLKKTPLRPFCFFPRRSC